MENQMTQKHGHYYKDITNLQKLDIYRIIDLYDVRDGAIQHAIKKLLLAGGRGVKDMRTDIQEAIDSLNRKLEMLNEDEDVEMLDEQHYLEDVQSRTITGYDSTIRSFKIESSELNEQEEISFAELDDLPYNTGTINLSTQSLNPKYNDVNYIKSLKKDESNFEAYLPSNFEVEEFLKKHPEDSYDSAFRKIAISNFQNMKYKLK